ncbi:hypothetical protein DES53_103345 [Roseimicrobium gellanilyticum]|uniref:Uncharacterized protein n=1 Tax=Roseimicrobium gellanilyticum TaxID=748857 RepID=A0A366HPC9_9BACT|nr:hypothetical protein [Roseimicrobium gellanilyticum]RBP45347.1 hypothetical protein DES53_103345 [Roseimicrobium gellanilyticum]
MNSRWFLGLGLGVVVLSFLGWCSRQAPHSRSWETKATPTDKPAVNFVISTRNEGEPFLERVVLSSEDPQTGKLVKRWMDFRILAGGRDRITFELKAAPGEIHELTLPREFSSSFKAELKSKSSGTVDVLQFDDVRK